MSSSYSRTTELRQVHPNDRYLLAVILDDNDYWKKLMETIPKDINNEIFASPSNSPNDDYSAMAASGRKYTNDHIRLIQNAFRRSGESRLCPQILFDEWGSSGRKNERPNLGLLLNLLLKAHLFRAADYVAENWLGEPKPPRPTDGPGAEITCDLPSTIFADIREMANDSQNYPDTELLQQNAKFGSSLMDNNKDYYTKYRDPIDKLFAPPTASLNDNAVAPKPPPRSNNKSARLLVKQQLLQQQQNLTQTQPTEASEQTANITNNHDIFTITENEQPPQPSNEEPSFTTTDNLPKISLLMESSNSTMEDQSLVYEDSTPKLSFLIGNSIRTSQASEELCSSNSALNIVHCNNVEASLTSDIAADEQHSHELPVISALNLNGERDTTSQPFNSIENVPSVALHFYSNNSSSSNNKHFNVPCVVEAITCDDTRQSQADLTEDIDDDVDNFDNDDIDIDDDDDDADVPNLSIFNDSSLTSVTNTSGDNSFEQNNDSRPASADNVPPLTSECISTLN